MTTGIKLLQWPFQPPELNPIENLWVELVEERAQDDLKRICEVEWSQMP